MPIGQATNTRWFIFTGWLTTTFNNRFPGVAISIQEDPENPDTAVIIDQKNIASVKEISSETEEKFDRVVKNALQTETIFPNEVIKIVQEYSTGLPKHWKDHDEKFSFKK